MIYGEYGGTGAQVSAVGFGGMRFDHSRSNEENAQLLLYAQSKGINYFDTAPGYCSDTSEDIFGIALKQMADTRDSYYVSTKGMPTSIKTADKARRAVEKSIRRLNVDKIAHNYTWGLLVDPNSGELLWLGSYRARAGKSHGPGPRATPYIDDGRVYTFGRSGDLACWHLNDGKLLWKRNVNDAGGETPKWGHSSSPLVYGDKVFVQGGGSAQAIAYQKMTGEIAWKAGKGDAGYAAPAIVNMGDEVGLLVFHGTGLACLDPDDGSEFWAVPWKTSYNVNATTPVSGDGIVLITSGYGTGCQALKVGDAGIDVLWTSKVIAAHHSDPFIIDGFIYGYSGPSNQNAGHFKCVRLDGGTEKWSTDKLGWGTTLYMDGHLLCMDNEGSLFLVKPDQDALIVVTQFNNALGDIDHPAWTIPVVANGKLYLRYLQRLVCYNLVGE